MLSKVKNLTAFMTASTVISLASLPAFAQAASIFSPILDQMQRQMPRGWVMRLPAFNEHLVDLAAYFYDLDDMLLVQLSPANCDSPSSSVCDAGRIYTSKNDRDQIELYQTRRRDSFSPITLQEGMRGFYDVGHAASGSYHSVIWQQDNQIYYVSSRMGKSAVIDLALSMANQPPVSLTSPTSAISTTQQEELESAITSETSEVTFSDIQIQEITRHLESEVGLSVSAEELQEGYENLIDSGISIGRILAIANEDPSLESFFDGAGDVMDAYATAKLVVDIANAFQAYDKGDKEGAVVALLEIGLSRNILARVYMELTGQDVTGDIAEIFNINQVRDLLHREIDGHFDDIPEIKKSILEFDPSRPYSDFEKDLQDAGLWDQWQKYLISDTARSFVRVFSF
jgi:hypothetical protein